MSEKTGAVINYLTAIDRLKTQLVCGDAHEILKAVGTPFKDLPGSVGIAVLDKGDHMILNFKEFQIKVSFEMVKNKDLPDQVLTAHPTVGDLVDSLKCFDRHLDVRIVLPRNDGPNGPDFCSALASRNEVGTIKVLDGEVLIERVI